MRTFISSLAVLAVLYALWLCISSMFNLKSEVDVAGKVSLVAIFAAYTFLLRLLTKFMVKLKIKEKVFTPRGIEFLMVFTYHGKDIVSLSKIKISGLDGVNAKLTYSAPNNETKTYACPEEFMTHLSSTQPVVTTKINLAFKRDPKPRFEIPFVRREVYIVKLSYKVGNSNKRKYIFIWRKQE